MGATIPDPRYLTLSTTGSGSVAFRAQRLTMILRVRKITIECPEAGPGRATITYRGQMISSKQVALRMSADGVLDLHPGEEVLVEFFAGPPSKQIKITAHYEEIPL